jgi:hypothetical protein
MCPTNHGAEVLGYEKSEILEKVHTKFCKIICKKSKYTHNTMIYGELGRVPISQYYKVRMVNFIGTSWCMVRKLNLGLYCLY